MDLILSTFLLIAFAAQVVAVTVTFGGGSRNADQVPVDQSGDR